MQFGLRLAVGRWDKSASWGSRMFESNSWRRGQLLSSSWTLSNRPVRQSGCFETSCWTEGNSETIYLESIDMNTWFERQGIPSPFRTERA